MPTAQLQIRMFLLHTERILESFVSSTVLFLQIVCSWIMLRTTDVGELYLRYKIDSIRTTAKRSEKWKEIAALFNKKFHQDMSSKQLSKRFTNYKYINKISNEDLHGRIDPTGSPMLNLFFWDDYSTFIIWLLVKIKMNI